MLRRLSRLGQISPRSRRDSLQPDPMSPLGGVPPLLPPNQPERKAIWLDADPGHDDAIALLIALHHPDLELLGVSTVAGNASGRDTFLNAVRLMAAYRAPTHIPLIRGADEPLVKQSKVDVGIHGEGGLGGVQGLPPLSSPLCQNWLHPTQPRTSSPSTSPEPALFLHTLSNLITDRLSNNKPPIHLAVTGPLTNAALFVKCYPHLLKGIAQIVIMGGAAGVRGNRAPLAEFNIMNDPEAASIVFDADIKVVMAGLNVTHQAIFTAELHDRLLSSSKRRPSQNQVIQSDPTPPTSNQTTVSELKKLLSSILTFFAKTYASEFGFTRGPPVHDMLAIVYIIDPTIFHRRVPSPGDLPCNHLFDSDPYAYKDHYHPFHRSPSPEREGEKEEVPITTHPEGKPTSSSPLENRDDPDQPFSSSSTSTSSSSPPSSPLHLVPAHPPKRYNVQVETSSSSLACGATVVDFWGDSVQHQGWSRGGRNVEVLENLDCPRLWHLFFQVVQRAEDHLERWESDNLAVPTGR
ncbi:nucleoside hydrolase [Violaceomyces palustris]|uniref:Nucleoside hydrolase n=1 Tax=Violaceomyces palustris TaxID=1673888 RepID=A0ACD0NM54_9BASI|nr:nucleoside hydrolase [Violaceomyces palustris]